MALANTYLAQAKNLQAILDSIRAAQAPERFTVKFLENLGYKSTNDRNIIPVLKTLGLLDESGAPKPRYYRFLDQELWKQVLAEGVREGYGDLFALNNSAHQMDLKWVKNKLKTLTQGSKSEPVLNKMAMTFVSLAKLGDFSTPSTAKPIAPKPEEAAQLPTTSPEEGKRSDTSRGRHLSLAYNIHVELPAVRDQAVYDAIFRSLRENLL
jgi:hypothetical protein